MKNVKNKITGKVIVYEELETPYMNKYDIYQDGTLPFARDKKGNLWTISGHSNMGHIGMFKGTCLDDMKEVYPFETDFKIAKAGEAFNCVKYPEDVLPRGSIWPFGLYICPNTNRFFCFFHNETGWNGQGTGYVVNGVGDGEPDFRHIGLMHSDDEGRTWSFDRWVITSEAVCFSEKYNPDKTPVLGQKAGDVCLGAGDFSIFDNPHDEYIYLFYNLCKHNSETGVWADCGMYVARTRKRTDGVMGDFVKYYDGAFCEAGNLGKETEIVAKAWHGRVVYSETLKIYVMSSARADNPVMLVDDYLELRTSDDLLHWSEPILVEREGKIFGNHYQTIMPENVGMPQVIGDEFSILTCHNGTDVLRYRAKIEK